MRKGVLRHELAILAFYFLITAVPAQAQQPDQPPPLPRWSAEKAAGWQKSLPWLVGCNYAPAYAINQLEMWQAETFDPAAIEKELTWAQGLGFNSLRVFLHNIPWEQDAPGFLGRLETFLKICEKHDIGVMFVLFDSVWDPFPKPGPQRAPRPHVHNSGWVQAPGLEILKDPARVDRLEGYVKGVVGHFANDRRVHAWDVVNEPDNRNGNSYGKFEPENKGELALSLMRKAFAWARACNPSQPLTCGVWVGDWSQTAQLAAWEKFQLEQSDVISFHSYGPLEEMKRRVENLKRLGRPVLCTEYMARPVGCPFDPVLGYLKDQNVAAYNWGFVAGKTQTIYPWETWTKSYTAEPPVWFHDIFRPDGTPFDPDEVAYIRSITGGKEKP